MDMAAIEKWVSILRRNSKKKFLNHTGWRAEVAAVVMRTVELWKGWSLSPPQIASISLLTLGKYKGNKLLQIPTGGGKTWTIAAVAAIQVLFDHKVDVIPSSSILARRDHDETKHFYKVLGITSDYVSSSEVGMSEVYSSDIVYGDIISLSGDYQRSRLKSGPEGKMWGTSRFDIAIVDEADNLLFDRRSHTVRLSSDTPGEMPLLLYMWTVLISLNKRVVEERDDHGSVSYYYVRDSFKIDDVTGKVYLTEQLPEHKEGPLGGSMEEAMKAYIASRELITTTKDTFLIEKLKEWGKKSQIRQDRDQNGKMYQLEKALCEYISSLSAEKDKKEFSMQVFREKVLPIMKATNTTISTKELEQDYTLVAMPEFLKKRLTDYHINEFAFNAVKALLHLKEGREYVVENNSVRVVDYQDTGEIYENMIWSGGLHQFLELKHGFELSSLALVSCSQSFAGFFKKYKRLLGMTGTVGGVRTREFLREQYGFDTLLVPSPFRLNVLPDVSPWRSLNNRGSNNTESTITQYPVKSLDPFIAPNKDIWWSAMVQYIKRIALSGRCVLVLMDTIELVDMLFKRLSKEGESLPEIYRFTGRLEEAEYCKTLKAGAVMIGTNILGRGENLLPDVLPESLGGLHICLTFLPVSRRVEWQNVGRTGRAGRAGSVQLILCLLSAELPPLVRAEWKFDGNAEIIDGPETVKGNPTVWSRVPALEYLIAERDRREEAILEESKKEMSEMMWRDRFTQSVIDWMTRKLFSENEEKKLRLLFQSKRALHMDPHTSGYQRDLDVFKQKFPSSNEDGFRAARYVYFRKLFFSKDYYEKEDLRYFVGNPNADVISHLQNLAIDEEDPQLGAEVRSGDNANEEEAEALMYLFGLWVAENLSEWHSVESRAETEKKFHHFLNSLDVNTLIECNPHFCIKKAVRLFNEQSGETGATLALELLDKAKNMGEGSGACIAEFFRFVPVLRVGGRDAKEKAERILTQAKKLMSIEHNRILNCILALGLDKNEPLLVSFENHLELYSVLIAQIDANITNLNIALDDRQKKREEIGITDFCTPMTLQEYLKNNHVDNLASSTTLIKRMEVDGLQYLYTVGLVPAKHSKFRALLRIGKAALSIGTCIPQVRIACLGVRTIISFAEGLYDLEEWSIDGIKDVLMDSLPSIMDCIPLEELKLMVSTIAPMIDSMCGKRKPKAGFLASCGSLIEDIGIVCGKSDLNGDELITRGGIGLAAAVCKAGSRDGFFAGVSQFFTQGFKELKTVYDVIRENKSIEQTEEENIFNALQMGIGSILCSHSHFRKSVEEALEHDTKRLLLKCLAADHSNSERTNEMKIKHSAKRVLQKRVFSEETHSLSGYLCSSPAIANCVRDHLFSDDEFGIDTLITQLDACATVNRVISSFPRLFFSEHVQDISLIAADVKLDVSNQTHIPPLVDRRMEELRQFYFSILCTHMSNASTKQLYASYARSLQKASSTAKGKKKRNEMRRSTQRVNMQATELAKRLRDPHEPMTADAIAAISALKKVRIQLFNQHKELVRDYGCLFEHVVRLQVDQKGEYSPVPPYKKKIMASVSIAGSGYIAIVNGLPFSLYNKREDTVDGLRERCAVAVEKNPLCYSMLMNISHYTENTSPLYILMDTFFKLRDERTGESTGGTLEERLECFLNSIKPSWIPSEVVFAGIFIFSYTVLRRVTVSELLVGVTHSVSPFDLIIEIFGALVGTAVIGVLSLEAQPTIFFSFKLLLFSCLFVLWICCENRKLISNCKNHHVLIVGGMALSLSWLLLWTEVLICTLQSVILVHLMLVSALVCIVVSFCYIHYLLFEWHEMRKIFDAVGKKQFMEYQLSPGYGRQSKWVSFILKCRDSPDTFFRPIMDQILSPSICTWMHCFYDFAKYAIRMYNGVCSLVNFCDSLVLSITKVVSTIVNVPLDEEKLSQCIRNLLHQVLYSVFTLLVIKIKDVSRLGFHKIKGVSGLAFHKIKGVSWLAFHEIKGVSWLAFHEIKGVSWLAFHKIKDVSWLAFHKIKDVLFLFFHEILTVWLASLQKIRDEVL